MCAVGVVVAIALGQRSRAMGASSANCASDRFWLASKGVGTLLTASKVTSLVFEVMHADCWELASTVVLGLILVNLVNGNGSVDNRRLNGLLLDDRLDVLMNVVVDVLASQRWLSRRSMLDITNSAFVLVLSCLSIETLLYVVIIAVLDISVLNTCHLMGVLFWEDLTVLDRLD